ncbi:MAG TPA: heme-binding sensor globin domain-containing protein [Nitrospirae bacterium]|nr:heme-binding sensor globin domain-containing protein [Nitrospirota bacterium]
MERFNIIKEHYNLTIKDEEQVQSLYPLIEKRVDRIIDNLQQRIIAMGDPVIIEKLKKHPDLRKHHKHWLLNLFRGPYDGNYHLRLVKVGKVHAALGIDPHHVSVSMNAIRAMLMDILSEEIDDRVHRTALKESLNKLIDINLDVITSSYVEEEIQQYSTAYRLKSSLVTFAERFSGAMNLVLVFALIFITLGVVGLFAYDVVKMFQEGLSRGIITALGSLLILWVLIELMNTEISHLKGGKFNISVFIGVALVAFIRDLMVVTLKHEKLETAYYFVAAILTLGLVYWLVIRAEQKRN